MSEEDQPIEQNENHVILERREKLKKIREAGIAFPNDFKPQHFAKTIHEEFDTPCFKLSLINGSRSPSRTPCVLPTSTFVRKSLMRD